MSYTIPIDTSNAEYTYFDNGKTYIVYCDRTLARKARMALIRKLVPRVTTEVLTKGEEFAVVIPHPDWGYETIMDIAKECSPKNPSGPRDSLQKNCFGDVIKQEKTEAELIEQEKRWKGGRKNLTPAMIEDGTFIHQALVEPYYGPSKQYSLGTIPPVIGEKSETPWLKFTGNELIDNFYKMNPEYKR